MLEIFDRGFVAGLLMYVFWLPKSDSSEDEYEDAFGSSESRFAVSDGATESSFARDWARALVDKFINYPPELKNDEVHFDSWLETLQVGWSKQIAWEHLPWNAVEKAHMGASAAFVGIEFIWKDDVSNNRGQIWRATALGDSCLFLIRRNKLFAFPLMHTSQFIYSRQLLSSIPENNREALSQILICEGWCENRDCFILATDALSSWILGKSENGEKPWEELLSLKSQDEFSCFIKELRDQKAITNDDVTLLIIQLEDRPTLAHHESVNSGETHSALLSSEQERSAQEGKEKSVTLIGNSGEAKEPPGTSWPIKRVPFEDQNLYPSISHGLFGPFASIQRIWRRIHPKKVT